MKEIIDKIKSIIEENWVVTNETANRIYFKYEDRRGTPRFYFNKKEQKVVRVDKAKESSKDAISVEVKTRIYSEIDPEVKYMTAQDVFATRHTEETKNLLEKYSGADDIGGGTL